MNAIHLENTLQQLIACWEDETVEFKSTYADDKSASDEIGKYTSALANEAALQQREYGWLVVGVCNKTRSVVGTNFKQTPDALKKLKHQLSQSTQPHLAPHHIYEYDQKTPRRYRNTFLIEAMVALNMNDKMGYGIYEMHKAQIQRYLPLPDYNLSDPNAVKLTLYGGEVDPCYTQTLMRNSHLSMEEILALDRVQKKQSIQDNLAKRLKESIT